MKKFFIAKVAVSNVIYYADKLYSYLIPEDKVKDVVLGKRVLVPFGIYNKKRQAMVYEVQLSEDLVLKNKLKSIVAVLDTEPLLSVELLSLSLYMKKAYFCTFYDAVKCMLPSALNYKIKEYLIFYDSCDKSILKNLNLKQLEVIEFIKKNSNYALKEEIIKNFNNSVEKILKELLKKGVILKEEKILRSTNDLKQRIIKLNEKANFEDFKITNKQKIVIDLLLKNKNGMSIKEIEYFSGVSYFVIKNLLSKNILEMYEEDVYRDPLKYLYVEKNYDEIKLSKDQTEVYLGLKNIFEKNIYNVSLLFGVTGSGKTSVFLKLIDNVIANGKTVILMVPEISLTPQMISIFKSRFQERVAIFHSGLSLGERLDEFKRVRQKKADIVVGTRSAVFAPLENIGLIVMDEEHEDTYKSDSTPRYHAREIAKYRCFKNNSMLILSSATPSIESFYLAQSKKYSFFYLKSRYGTAKLPRVSIVDMNKENMDGNTSFFSRELINNLKQNFDNGKQSILLLNRRGYSTFAKCRNCGEVVMCPNCSTSLNYHIKNNKLMCHHCGFSIDFLEECPNCHKKKLIYMGIGTQKVEEELKKEIKNCKILRMDTDTNLRKNSYDINFNDFSKGKYDIIVGTQMVAKGLNFPNVTLVGVISMDQYLMGEDFRSDEKTFSLITQVVGRSGRFDDKGKAIIQTFLPESETIKLSAKQDYINFYKNEIIMRKALLYPPYVNLSAIFFVGLSESKVKAVAKEVFLKLKDLIKKDYKDFSVKVFGPLPSMILKVNKKYKYKIILKYKDKVCFRLLMKDLLSSLNENKSFNGVSVFVDTNPNTLI